MVGLSVIEGLPMLAWRGRLVPSFYDIWLHCRGRFPIRVEARITGGQELTRAVGRGTGNSDGADDGRRDLEPMRLAGFATSKWD